MGIPTVKNDAHYKALKETGYSKETTAPLANTPQLEKKEGASKPYEKWTRTDLYKEAKKLDIKGRSKMDKNELIYNLRNN